MPILFYRTAERYGCFSNFSKHPVHIYGVQFPTSEHAFQAMKFFPHRCDLVEKVQHASTPREAARLGRERSHPLHADWESSPGKVLSFRLPEAADVRLQPDDGIRHEEPLFNRYKDLIMYEVVYAKVVQHPDIRALLLGTQTAPIIEDSTEDRYWGWGSSHDGENKLGRVFMAVRAALVDGALTKTPFGKPDRVNFVCAADYPWRSEFGTGSHPEAVSKGAVSRDVEGFECPHCGHYFEASRSV